MNKFGIENKMNKRKKNWNFVIKKKCFVNNKFIFILLCFVSFCMMGCCVCIV